MARFQAAIDLESSDPSLLRIERHSFVNLINVVHAELQLIERMAEAPGSLRSAIYLAEAASRAFKESRVARRHLEELSTFAALIESDVEEAMRVAGELADDEGVVEARDILTGVLGDAHLRIQEVIVRHEIFRTLSEFSHQELAAAAETAGVAFDGDSDRYELPLGFERLFGYASESEGVQISEIRITGTDPIAVDICGNASETDLRTLSRNLRAGELQKEIESRGRALKSLVLLHYLALPREGLTIELADGGFCASANVYDVDSVAD